jgi:hypothetical protein
VHGNQESNGCVTLRVIKRLPDVNLMIDIQSLEFPGSNYGFMEFSQNHLIVLESHCDEKSYYLTIVLRYENHSEIRVIKLSNNECISDGMKRI